MIVLKSAFARQCRCQPQFALYCKSHHPNQPIIVIARSNTSTCQITLIANQSTIIQFKYTSTTRQLKERESMEANSPWQQQYSKCEHPFPCFSLGRSLLTMDGGLWLPLFIIMMCCRRLKVARAGSGGSKREREVS